MAVQTSDLGAVVLFCQHTPFLQMDITVLEGYVKKKQLTFSETFMLMKMLKVFPLIFSFDFHSLCNLLVSPAPEEKRRAKDGRLEKVQMC